MQKELKVKVGDRLCLSDHCGSEIVTVKRVTQTGRIRIDQNGFQYDKYGNQMGCGTWDWGSYLSYLTEEKEREIHEKETIKKARAVIEKRSLNLTFEEAKKILEVLK